MPENEILIRTCFGVIGFIAGFFSHILSDKFRLRLDVGADLVGLLHVEILTIGSGQRSVGVTNADAIRDLVQVIDRYRDLLITRRRRSIFDKAYKGYKDQIDKKNLHQESDDCVTTFGYKNYITAGQSLWAMIAFIE
ncbi:hypothetical protein [Desulfobacter hydrogenophilus]|uniref:Uncharacterized protein n=1 Tax=Desulfobacter hydrogenophilus TaxID=2291 RepID=A0ABX5RI04_9BACT|nr:hypothetical protein [Desulfobacter hydrogenophilus]NDY74459.1 hypothetical protein [Desulfobacter hydrogenophilus]QBH14297.1 hypothetical protein EYB58_16065 [Desulfobacter hydrogenophilus]